LADVALPEFDMVALDAEVQAAQKRGRRAAP
jgi:hypothetical protein